MILKQSIKILLVVCISIFFTACVDTKENLEKINSEKKVKFPKPEWDVRLADIESNNKKRL